jgi:hypothetical protein
MEKADVESLKAAVEGRHGAAVSFSHSVAVNERRSGSPVWQGIVHAFDLVGHPTAKRAYAWS